MYIHLDDLSEVLHKYFLYRCRNCVLFSLKVGGYVCGCGCVGMCVCGGGGGGGGGGWGVSVGEYECG